MTKTKTVRAISTHFIILALLIPLFVAVFSFSASALATTQYQTGSWNASTKTVTLTTSSATATSVTAADTAWGTTGQTKYYVVDSAISATANVNIYGEVHLILKNNYTNTKNLIINENASLHIHKATDATSAILTVNQIECKGTAVVIHGGTVKSTQAYYHGIHLSNGDAIIYAGTVNSTIGRDSGGPAGGGGSIKIYGGEVNVTATYEITVIGADYYNDTEKLSSIEIYNAKVVAKNQYDLSLPEHIIGGIVDRIIIENSNVSATSNGHQYSSGSGIGGVVDEIQITNSTVSAWGGLDSSSAGIGGSRANNVYLTNSTVTAQAGDYGTPIGYGIYCKNLTVDGGYVTTDTGSESTAWKGAGYHVTESMTVLSGTVDAREGIWVPGEAGLVIKGGNVLASNIYSARAWQSTEKYYTYTAAVPVDASGNVLYGRTVALDGVSDKTSITAITGAPSGYSLVGMKTVGNTICIWGGADAIPTQITVGDNQYKGAIQSGALNTSGTFYKAHTCADSNSDDLCDSCGSVMSPTVQNGVYLIYDLNDYQYFKALVEGTLKNGELDPQAKVRLMADLDIGKITIGTEGFPFRGEFDGNYHSLTVNLSNVPTGTTLAPFNYADGAAFKRLTVKGSIYSDLEKIGSNQNCINIGGFVGITKGEPVSFDECINLAHVEINNPKGSPTANLGGFVGMNYTTLTFTNCASLGRIDVGLSDGGSGVVGNSQDGCKVYLDSCYIYFTFGIAKSNIYRSASTKNNSYVSRKPNDTHITNSYYNVTQEDTPGVGEKAGGIGVTNTGSQNSFESVKDEDIANGNLVNLLNKGDNSTGVWKQTLTGDNVDAYPNFTGKRIAWNIDAQKYDNHTHTDVYNLATVTMANDTVNVSCPVCCPSGQNVTISIPAEHTYDVNTAPTATVTGSESITVVYMNGSTALSEAPKAAGNYTASFTLGGKTATVAYTILPKSIEGVDVENDVTVSGNGVTFNGNEQTLNVTEIKLDGVTLVEGTDFTVTGNKQTNAGEHTVTVTGKGNYKGSFTLTYTIHQADINGASVTVDPIAYTGSALEPELTVIFNGKMLSLNADYTALYENNVNAYDSPTVTLTGKGNFKGEITKSFIIDKAIPQVTAPADANRTYNGEPQTIINAGTTTAGTVMWYSLDGIAWATDLPSATDADTYMVYYKVVGNDSYKDVDAQIIQVTLSPKVLTEYANNRQPYILTYKEVTDGFITEAENLQGCQLSVSLHVAHHAEVVKHHDTEHDGGNDKDDDHHVHDLHKGIVAIHDHLLFLLARNNGRGFNDLGFRIGINRADMILNAYAVGIGIGHHDVFRHKGAQISCDLYRIGFLASVRRKLNGITYICGVLQSQTKVNAIVGKLRDLIIFGKGTNLVTLRAVDLHRNGLTLVADTARCLPIAVKHFGKNFGFFVSSRFGQIDLGFIVADIPIKHSKEAAHRVLHTETADKEKHTAEHAYKRHCRASLVPHNITDIPFRTEGELIPEGHFFDDALLHCLWRIGTERVCRRAFQHLFDRKKTDKC